MNESKTVKRLYIVTETTKDGAQDEKIIEASSQAQAIAKVVSGRFDAAPASARDVMRIRDAEQAK